MKILCTAVAALLALGVVTGAWAESPAGMKLYVLNSGSFVIINVFLNLTFAFFAFGRFVYGKFYVVSAVAHDD